jgi:hypothetical protein
MTRSSARARWTPALVGMVTLTVMAALVLLAAPAAADVFHIKLRNGTLIDSLYQPQQASWDPNLVLVLTDVGNWIGIDQREVESVDSESHIRGFGVAINNTTIAIGWAPNDLPDAAAQNPQTAAQLAAAQALQSLYQQEQAKAHYTIQQGVSTDQTQGIPGSLIPTYGSGYGGLGGSPSSIPPTLMMQQLAAPAPTPPAPSTAPATPPAQQ